MPSSIAVRSARTPALSSGRSVAAKRARHDRSDAMLRSCPVTDTSSSWSAPRCRPSASAYTGFSVAKSARYASMTPSNADESPAAVAPHGTNASNAERHTTTKRFIEPAYASPPR